MRAWKIISQLSMRYHITETLINPFGTVFVLQTC